MSDIRKVDGGESVVVSIWPMVDPDLSVLAKAIYAFLSIDSDGNDIESISKFCNCSVREVRDSIVELINRRYLFPTYVETGGNDITIKFRISGRGE